MSDQQKPGSKVVAKTEEAACGCARVFYSDGSGELTPCVPCAMIQAGEHLSQAGALMRAAGVRFGREIQQAKVRQLDLGRVGG